MKELSYKFQQYLITEKRCALNTIQAYQSDLQQAILFFEQQDCTTFHDVTTQHVKNFLYHVRVDLKSSARSLSRKLSCLKSLSKYLQTYHGVHDFTFNVTFPKLEKNLPKFLTEHQILDLFNFAQKDSSPAGRRNHIMITLAYVCGIRVSELIQLTRTNINFDDKLLKITGKGNKQRIVPIPDTIVDLLHDYLQTAQPYLFKNMIVDSDLLFPTLYANQVKPMSRQSFWGILKDIVKKINLPMKTSPHILRHSIATHLLKEGANLRLLQMALGHEQLETVQVYTHVEVSHLRILYDKNHPRS